MTLCQLLPRTPACPQYGCTPFDLAPPGLVRKLLHSRMRMKPARK